MKKENISLERRFFFKYQKNHSPQIPQLPIDYKIREINEELFHKIKGNVTPLFSWSSSGEFLNKGKGYCITHGENIAAWAFSAAVSKDEIDIGIETDSCYRHLGLGAVIAEKMVECSLQQHKNPVWA